MNNEELNIDFSTFDDEAQKAKEEALKQAKYEADKELPPDPNAILEVRHLKKYFTIRIKGCR